MRQEFQTKTELLEMVKGKNILVWVSNLWYVRVTKKELMLALEQRKYVMGKVLTLEKSVAIEFN